MNASLGQGRHTRRQVPAQTYFRLFACVLSVKKPFAGEVELGCLYHLCGWRGSVLPIIQTVTVTFPARPSLAILLKFNSPNLTLVSPPLLHTCDSVASHAFCLFILFISCLTGMCISSEGGYLSISLTGVSPAPWKMLTKYLAKWLNGVMLRNY